MIFDSDEDSTASRAPRRAAALARQVRGRAAREAGYAGEDVAARYLETRGLWIVERNARGKGGEIDIVARDGQTLVFCEVRLRRRTAFGGAAESITAEKRRRIATAAQLFLLRRAEFAHVACRFDCVLIGADGACEWLRDAFRLD